MSQHDYVIDNQDGASFRSDINAVLAAVLTSNSGDTAPTTTKPFMPWYDTTAGALKIRNAADTAWGLFTDYAAGSAVALTGNQTVDGNKTFTGTTQLSTITDGTNSTSATNAIQGSAKAWVNFNGSGGATIRASHNVSSVVRNAVGDYTINFTNALADANYVPTTMQKPVANATEHIRYNTATTTSFRCTNTNSSNTNTDTDVVLVAIFR